MLCQREGSRDLSQQTVVSTSKISQWEKRIDQSVALITLVLLMNNENNASLDLNRIKNFLEYDLEKGFMLHI